MKLLTLFTDFFKNIWFYRRNKKKDETFDDILGKLEKAIIEKQRHQFIIQGEIMHKMKSYLKIGASSEFIPINGKSEFEIRTYIDKKWGERMKRWDIYLTDDMKLDIR